MNVLGISCSPKKNGCTVTLVNEALKGAKQEGAKTELYSLSGKDIKPCDGCRTCAKTGVCRIKDDMHDLYKKMTEANAIIYGTPTYFYSMASQTKIIIDRSRALHDVPTKNLPNRLANKVGGVIAVGGSLGLVDILKDLYFYMITHYMLPGDYAAVYALEKKELEKRVEGKKAVFTLGRQMARLASIKFEYPSDLMTPSIAYGTWKH